METETGCAGSRQLRRVDFTLNQSVLSQFRDPDQYPEITFLGDQYKRFKLYRDWDSGRNSALRKPQPVDQPNHFLAEDASNLGLVLNYLERTGDTKDTLNSHLSRFYDQFKDYSISVEGGTVQVFFLRERNLGITLFRPRAYLMEPCVSFVLSPSSAIHPRRR